MAKKPKTKVLKLIRQIDDLGYPGYSVSVDGGVLGRRGSWLGDVVRACRPPGKWGSMLKLEDDSGKIRELARAWLIFEAAFGRMEWRTPGFELRFRDGNRSNCALANLSYAPLKPRRLMRYKDGSALTVEDLMARGFTWQKVPV